MKDKNISFFRLGRLCIIVFWAVMMVVLVQKTYFNSYDDFIQQRSHGSAVTVGCLFEKISDVATHSHAVGNILSHYNPSLLLFYSASPAYCYGIGIHINRTSELPV